MTFKYFTNASPEYMNVFNRSDQNSTTTKAYC